MSCIKTGFHAYLTPHSLYLYGDAFELFGVTYFRICQATDKPVYPVIHFTIGDFAEWFDKDKTSIQQNSTMICSPFDVTNHGYEGKPL